MLILAVAVSGATAIGAAGCRPRATMEQKLDAWLIHQRKMEVILQDVQMDCDSTVEATLRYRVDSLEKALLPAPHPAHHAHHETGRHHHRS